jgi:hypothetical protein
MTLAFWVHLDQPEQELKRAVAVFGLQTIKQAVRTAAENSGKPTLFGEQFSTQVVVIPWIPQPMQSVFDQRQRPGLVSRLGHHDLPHRARVKSGEPGRTIYNPKSGSCDW